MSRALGSGASRNAGRPLVRAATGAAASGRLRVAMGSPARAGTASATRAQADAAEKRIDLGSVAQRREAPGLNCPKHDASSVGAHRGALDALARATSRTGCA